MSSWTMVIRDFINRFGAEIFPLKLPVIDEFPRDFPVFFPWFSMMETLQFQFPKGPRVSITTFGTATGPFKGRPRQRQTSSIGAVGAVLPMALCGFADRGAADAVISMAIFMGLYTLWILTRWGPRWIAAVAFKKWLNSMVYGRYNELVNGGYHCL